MRHDLGRRLAGGALRGPHQRRVGGRRQGHGITAARRRRAVVGGAGVRSAAAVADLRSRGRPREDDPEPAPFASTRSTSISSSGSSGGCMRRTGGSSTAARRPASRLGSAWCAGRPAPSPQSSPLRRSTSPGTACGSSPTGCCSRESGWSWSCASMTECRRSAAAAPSFGAARRSRERPTGRLIDRSVDAEKRQRQ